MGASTHSMVGEYPNDSEYVVALPSQSLVTRRWFAAEYAEIPVGSCSSQKAFVKLNMEAKSTMVVIPFSDEIPKCDTVFRAGGITCLLTNNTSSTHRRQ